MQEKTQHFSKKFKNMTFRPNNVRFLLRNSRFSLDIFDPIEHIASQEIGDKDDHYPFANKGPAVFIDIDKEISKRTHSACKDIYDWMFNPMFLYISTAIIERCHIIIDSLR